MHNLFNHAYPILLSTGVAASDTSTDHYTSWVDTRGYEGASLIIHAGCTGDPSGTYHAEMSTTSTATAGTDIYGTSGTLSTAFAADDSLVIADIFRPTKRYVRWYFDRATTGEYIQNAIALLYRSALAPTSFSTAYNVSDVNIAVGTSS